MLSSGPIKTNKPNVYFQSLIFTDDTIIKSLSSQKKNNKYILRIIEKQNRLICHDFYFSQQNQQQKSSALKFFLNIKLPQNSETIYLCQVNKNSLGQTNENKIAKGRIDMAKTIQMNPKNKQKLSLYLYGIKNQKKDQTIAIVSYSLQIQKQKQYLDKSQASNYTENSFLQSQALNKQRKLNYKFVYERQKMTQMSKQQSRYQDNNNLKNSKNLSNMLEDSIIQSFNKDQKIRNKNSVNNSFSMNYRYEDSEPDSQPRVKIHFPEQKVQKERKIVSNLIFFKFEGNKQVKKKEDRETKKIRVGSQQTDYTQKREKMTKQIVYNNSIIPSSRNLLKTSQISENSIQSIKTIQKQDLAPNSISRKIIMRNSIAQGKFSIRNAISQRKKSLQKKQQSQQVVPVTLSLSSNKSSLQQISKINLKQSRNLNHSLKIIQSPLNKKYKQKFSVGQISPRLKQLIQKNEEQTKKNFMLLKISKIVIFLNSLQDSDYYSHHDSWLFQDSFSYFVQIIHQKSILKHHATIIQDLQTQKQMLAVNQQILIRNFELNSEKKVILNIIKQNKSADYSLDKSKIMQQKVGTSIISFNQLEYFQNQQKNNNSSTNFQQNNVQEIYFEKCLIQKGQQIGKFQLFYEIKNLQHQISSKKKLQWKTLLFSNSDINPENTIKEDQEKLPPIKLNTNKHLQKFKKKNSKYREGIINIK